MTDSKFKTETPDDRMELIIMSSDTLKFETEESIKELDSLWMSDDLSEEHRKIIFSLLKRTKHIRKLIDVVVQNNKDAVGKFSSNTSS